VLFTWSIETCRQRYSEDLISKILLQLLVLKSLTKKLKTHSFSISSRDIADEHC